MLNIMKITLDFILQNITILISFLALIVTIFSVNEIRKQRKKMYEPFIILEGGFWNTKESGEDYPPYLVIRNIGFGAAIDIQAEWSIDKYISQNSDISFNERIINTKGISLRDGSEINASIKKEFDVLKQFTHILPINMEKESNNLRIPRSVYMNFILKVISERRASNAELVLTIKYKDINSKEVKKKFIVNIGFISITKFDESDVKWEIDFLIEVSESK